LSVMLICLSVLSLLLGRYPKPGLVSLHRLASDPMAQRLILNLRLPRIITAILLGAALSGAGCSLQMIFRNPLIEPGFLGITQGAAFGAALAILALPGSPFFIQVSAVLFGVAGLFLSWFTARRLHYGGWVIRMIISGIAVSALFSAGLGLLKYMADPMSELQEMTFWMLGGLNAVTWNRMVFMLPLVLPSLLLMYFMRWRLNILSLDDMTAFSLGSRPARERIVLLLAASLAVAGVTAVAGIISWVGLLVPHIARKITGADAGKVLPVSLLTGALFMLICDDLARTIIAFEIPLGIITSFLGAGFFIILFSTQVMGIKK